MTDSTLKTSYNERRTSPLSQSRISKAAMDGALSKISTGETVLSEGSKLKARVMDFMGKELTLRLSDGSVLNAKTAQGTPLSIGQMAEFEVVRSGKDQLLLKLINNSSTNSESSVAGRALAAAGLPVTEENLSLVNTLLENRLPVDAESVQLVARQANMYKGTEVTTLAQMNKYNIPVNNATIQQFNSYLNYEQALLPKLESLVEAMDSLGLTEMIDFSETAEAATTSDFPSENPQAQSIPEHTPTNSVANETAGMSVSQGTPEVLASDTVETAFAQTAAESSAAPERQLSEASAPADSPSAEKTSEQAAAAANTTKALNSLQFGTTMSGGITLNNPGALHTATPNTAQNNPENKATLLSEETEPAANTATEAEEPVTNAADLLKRWSITPDKIKNKGELEKVLERINKDLGKIEEALKKVKEKHPDTESALNKLASETEKSVNTLKDNLNFMNMLNRFFPYVQLPVRLNNKYAQGELFVYSRKNVKKTDGTASVLLHLDMENLGPTDIHLSLAGSTLAAKFYVADDTISKLVGQHMPELTEKLEAQGLTVNYELLPREEADTPVRNFLATEENVSMKRYRFDCRA